MTDPVESEILNHFDRGDKVLIARSHTGQSKVKIKFGLLGLRTKRINLDNEAIERLRGLLREHRAKLHH